MRITYVTHTRFPTEKAHGLQVASVCQALNRLGHAVTLVTPTIGNPIAEDPLAYYGIPSSAFSVIRLLHFNALCSRWIPGKLAFLVAMRSFRRALSALFPAHRADLLYTRSPHILPPLLAAGIPVVLELHTLPRVGRRAFIAQCRCCAIVVCLTRPMRDALLSWGLDAERVLTEGDAVDLARFRALPRGEDAKARWRLPPDRPVVSYVGSLVTSGAVEKGVRELLEALALLRARQKGVFGWIVGGPGAWRERYLREAQARGLTGSDVRLEGAIPFADTADALSACDILVYPAPASRHPFFVRDTSPLKLFEYMAAGRPIVCADLPPLRDAVDASCVRFCAPGNPQGLAEGIAWVLDHPGEAAAMAARARERVQRHSWEERMRRILAAAC